MQVLSHSSSIKLGGLFRRGFYVTDATFSYETIRSCLHIFIGRITSGHHKFLKLDKLVLGEGKDGVIKYRKVVEAADAAK